VYLTWKLVKLFVEGISDVEWNTDVFKHQLVMKQQKKDLIEALVTVHSSSSLRLQKTDVIERKAKGLIILLHGSPGTGKTLTAESIAEYTHRPLYRLNAGDIGVDPESVEKYLEVVFYLGTLWNCVVLLDEADVFLEERAATDLQRNALVASFLRILEYFEGVLVLTSNRVGVFDEAFQSRVQLAIYYPPLDSDSRFEIWKTFFDIMLGSDEKNKQREIERKLGFLANQKMNGRQIRNVFNTARQLARFKKEDLSYSHIEQALDVAKEFQDYITATHGHTDEEFAKEGRLR
jgi:SpoVK/Ycf46/Vps4 family AAA+-type ATPase